MKLLNIYRPNVKIFKIKMPGNTLHIGQDNNNGYIKFESNNK